MEQIIEKNVYVSVDVATENCPLILFNCRLSVRLPPTIIARNAVGR